MGWILNPYSLEKEESDKQGWVFLLATVNQSWLKSPEGHKSINYSLQIKSTRCNKNMHTTIDEALYIVISAVFAFRERAAMYDLKLSRFPITPPRRSLTWRFLSTDWNGMQEKEADTRENRLGCPKVIRNLLTLAQINFSHLADSLGLKQLVA